MSVERSRPSGPPRVLIAGAGVAGLETLLALRALAGDRVDITIVAPELKFINEPMSVERPFKTRRGRGVRLESMLAEFDARWVRAELDRVVPDRHIAVTGDGEQLRYDRLVLALGARHAQWVSRSLFYRDTSHPFIYRGGSDGPDYRLLLQRLHEGRANKLAFLRPAGPSWPLPLYDLALMTAARCAARGDSRIELSLVTPEEEPLGIFGRRASAAIRDLLDEAGVTLHTDSYGDAAHPGWLDLAPGERRIAVDRVVTEPRLKGPRLLGVPRDGNGFIPTDARGAVDDLPGVFAAGDATSFPVKQGGLAAQQADAVAEAIAASVGIEIDPQPFQPVLRGVLFTGGAPRYLRSDISGRAGDDSTISPRALWWPPNKLAGRYLAPYLCSRLGEAADVLRGDAEGTTVDTQLASEAPEEWPELADLPRTNTG